ncbi:Desumoylating isopeptidase 1 (DeSI-1) (PPPDE peptidase domain-containing protein 2) [Durusdinium trenchii]|uniref:Desumoylating isopeptidase 1 (DeSI-1) (PPPDE peptidase domain-containing protein 2) n=1 Tax=Durusdinium trenchii TaxID=1381693 RepID=A0ABP0LX83_9DINO
MLDWLEEMLAAPCWAGPCFNCQAGKTQHRSQTLRTLRSPGHEVHLAVSPLGGLRGLGGYHTSVLIAGEEYYFSPSGLHCCSKMYSHPEEVVVRTFVGLSAASGAELLSFLGEHFREGSYDLLRKNCNAFTDCALYFLCEQRLDLRYRAMEQLAWMANDRTGILQSLTNGEYSPNPLAQEPPFGGDPAGHRSGPRLGERLRLQRGRDDRGSARERLRGLQRDEPADAEATEPSEHSAGKEAQQPSYGVRRANHCSTPVREVLEKSVHT